MISPLYLKQMELGPMQNYVYLIGDRNAREVLVVDPAWDVNTILKTAEQEGFQVKGALVTHAHFDHVNGLEDLLHRTGGIAYVNKHEAEFLKDVKGNMKKMDAGDKLNIGNVEITFIHTPGHTPGSQCFLINNNLVSGDTLFINACGRCDLPGGNAEEMYHSLRKLADLDEKTVLYPGHNYSDEPVSTIGNEKQFNPYLQMSNFNDFLKYRVGY